jgi:hypothetical protein
LQLCVSPSFYPQIFFLSFVSILYLLENQCCQLILWIFC